jgi:acid phosphatase family membrane protein YuiD
MVLQQKQLIINELVKDVAENKECTKDFKDIKGLLNKKWFVFGGAMIAIFIAFFVYPYFLSLHFKDLLPALKGFFSFLS